MKMIIRQILFLVTLVVFGFGLTLLSAHQTFAASEFGVNASVASLQSSGSQQSAVSAMQDIGFGWVRQEITYANPVDFAPYDSGISKDTAGGLSVLALLSYPGSEVSHDDWKSFVQTVVDHFGSQISAWEIMNEVDTALSGSDYVPYLNEARDIIKANNASAIIVASGITSRIEATSFWDGIAGAGGWDSFDKIGLHVYHTGAPETVNFGGGDILGEISRVVGSINKNGGGKKIWITELGYQSGSVGETDQANWLARTLIMLRSSGTVEKTFLYHLYDEGGDSYGLTDSGFSHKPSYDKVKSVVDMIAGKGTGTRIFPLTKTVIDSLDSTEGWSTEATSNGTTTLSTETGHTGSGMKVSYSFSADSAYAVAEKSIAIDGTPTALAAWLKGDDTKNIWKFRFKDTNGETFQTDIGNVSSDWQYVQFSIGTDTAITSWGGDGRIDFPISFNAIVLDRQSGGSASGSGIVDEITAVTGDADLYAYTFGSTAAFWKGSGSSTNALCSASIEFRTDPQYREVGDCSDTPTTAPPQIAQAQESVAVTQPTTEPIETPKKTVKKADPPPPPKPAIDVTKSGVRVDGKDTIADDSAEYILVITLTDVDGKQVTDQQPEIFLSGGQTTVKKIVLVGAEWWIYITSSETGERTAVIKIGDTEIASVKFTFIALPKPVEPVKEAPVTPTAAPAPIENKPNKTTLPILIGFGAIIAGSLIGYLLHRFKNRQKSL